MELTEKQKYVLYKLVTGVRNGVQEQRMGGLAGTGKSTLLSFIARMLPKMSTCAYTGKAVQVLRKKGMVASTIHSLIYRPVYDYGDVYFELVPPEDMTCEGFLVDEASMVSGEIYSDLMSFGMPVIYLGDHGQLEPIGTDFNLMQKPDYILEEIHRNAGDIAHFAELLRQGRSPTHFRKDSEKVRIMRHWDLTTDLLMSVDQVICSYNKTRVELNARIRAELGYKELVEVGERVMCLKNNRQLGLFNGMQGTVVDLYEDERGRELMDFEYDDFVIKGIWYDTEQFGKEKPDNSQYSGREYPNPFDYAYACTCHKIQGSEMPKALVYQQKCNRWDQRRWDYTAASRPKEELLWVS